jgi:hypothetical protein
MAVYDTAVGQVDTQGAGLFEALDNRLSGNLDYLRERELQDISNAFSESEAQKARDFSERMSSTAYQRAMSDLKAAGLNPALAISQGGASTPYSAYASASSAHAGKSGEGWREIGNILTSLLGGAFKVATTSMMNEARMAQTLERSSSAYEIALMNADARLLARRK